jgi:hypothetical protein
MSSILLLYLSGDCYHESWRKKQTLPWKLQIWGIEPTVDEEDEASQ